MDTNSLFLLSTAKRSSHFERIKTLILSLLILINCTTCKKNTPPVTTEHSSNTDVYICGTIYTSSGIGIAVYWKNGVMVNLGDGKISSAASSIVAVNDDIYISGSIGNNAVYWKNEVLNKLDSSSKPSYAIGIAVSGADIYVIGHKIAGNGQAAATYWKNGVEVRIAADTIDNTYCNAIFFNGVDNYIVGRSDHAVNSYKTKALYWKNGVQKALPVLSNVSNIAYAGAVVDNDLYIVGSSIDTTMLTIYNTRALMWKNDVAQILTGDPLVNYAIALAVKDNNFYIAGRVGYNGGYWKNGVAHVIAPGTAGTPSTINAVAINGTDVYMTGDSNKQATYWKNDQPIILASSGSGTGVAIIQH